MAARSGFCAAGGFAAGNDTGYATGGVFSSGALVLDFVFRLLGVPITGARCGVAVARCADNSISVVGYLAHCAV